MNTCLEIIIFVIAAMGIFLTYISLKNCDEIYYSKEHNICTPNLKKVEIVIKTINYSDEEINGIVNTLKGGNFDNLSELVDSIKLEKYNL